MFDQISARMNARSAALLVSLDHRLDRILRIWLLVAGLASAARIAATAPLAVPAASFSTFVSYMLLVATPVGSTLLALRWFSNGHLQPQPTTRLARAGRWIQVRRSDAEAHPLYGTSGIMVSLMVGMMLNVPVRAAEYLTAMPPMPLDVPHWLSALHLAMTFDVVVFSSLYMIAFVAALRRVPLFPRLLVAIWMCDLAMQLGTATLVKNAGHVPPDVATALTNMLTGNVKKTLISAALWLPYLLLSTRVNVTYRHRVPA
jgi:hypothetical protein